METLDSKLKNQRVILFVFSFSLIGFLLITFFRSSFTTIDISVNSWSASIQSSLFTEVAKIIDYGFGTIELLAASLLVAVYLFYKNYRKNALLLVGAVISNFAIITIVKMLIHSVRPLNVIIQETGFSFPSGHVTSTVVLFGLLTYFIWQHWKSSKIRISISIFFVVITLIVGLSRIYLNVHWLSDVLGGYLLGLFWLTFSILVFRYLERTINSKYSYHKIMKIYQKHSLSMRLKNMPMKKRALLSILSVAAISVTSAIMLWETLFVQRSLEQILEK